MVLSLFIFAGCGNSTELTISIGDGKVDNDAVSVLLKYNDTWKSGEKIFTVNYGHESDAVLADEYSVSFCDVDPLSENSVTLKKIYSFTKADLEDRTVDNGRFSGKEGEIIAGDLEDYLPQGEGTLSVYITVDTLEYLKKSGRISAFTAQMGKLFGIKPVLSIRKGVISLYSKQRGMKKSKKEMFRSLADDVRTRFAGLDKNRMTVCVAGTCVDKKEIAEIKDTLSEMFPGRPVCYDELPACIGCHTGGGAVGIGVCFDD